MPYFCFLLPAICSCVAFLHYSLPEKEYCTFFTLQSGLPVVADLEITNNTKDSMEADIKPLIIFHMNEYT